MHIVLCSGAAALAQSGRVVVFVVVAVVGAEPVAGRVLEVRDAAARTTLVV